MTALVCHREFHYRLKRNVLLFILSTLSICGLDCGAAWAQINPRIAATKARIAEDLATIRVAEKQHLSEAQKGALWRKVALEYQSIASFPQAEDAYNRSLYILKTAPESRAEYASSLDNLATLYLSYARLDDAESTAKQALMERKKLGKLSEIGLSQIRLADIALVRHQFKKAEQQAQRALENMQSSPDPPKTGILSAYITLTYARCSRGHCDAGVISAEQAVAFATKMFEPESAAVGFALEARGFAKWKSGSPQEGEEAMLQALKIVKMALAANDPRLAGVMSQYRNYLLEVNRKAEAEDIQQQVTGITREAGISCATCAISARSLVNTLR